MTGDIWSTGAFAHESPMKDLLESSDFTIEQLLAEDELLQELRGLHPQLLDYFSTEKAVTKLVQYLILDPDQRAEAVVADVAAAKAEAESSNINMAPAAEQVAAVEGSPSEKQEEETKSEGVGEEKEGESSDSPKASREQEPGKWLFQQLEKSTSGDSCNLVEGGNGRDKNPEHNPDNKFIRFPFMACEVVCCEMQGVINVLVDGFVPIDGADDSSTKISATVATVTTAPATASSPTANEGEGEDVEEAKPATEPQPPSTSNSSTSSTDDDDSQSPKKFVAEGEKSKEDNTQLIQPTQQQQQPPEKRQRILDLFLSVLYTTEIGELDDYRAGYLEKILSVLFRKRPQAMSEYMNSGGGQGSPILMKAMFQHLYSHSIMQLVQRLLLPHPQQMQQNQEEDNGSGDEDDEDDDGNLILGAQAGGDDADDESKILKCNWSESGDALDLLLQPLIYPTASLAAPTTEENGSSLPENGDALSEEEEDRRLNLQQNSSEVLITIIQNSPLNSDTMLRLTIDPIMQRLVDGSSCLKDGEDFTNHESILTATMNVLESLILQLGGYGSVGTISLLPTEENGEKEDGQPVDEQPPPPPPPQFADLTSLLAHIPRLLRSLSVLLLHPSCEAWSSPMQFSKPSEPQLLLGMARLRIVRLLESLVLLGESNVDALLCQSDCLEICLDLFWKFQWCSMLHQSVANLLVHVFEGANARSEMQEYFLVKCNLLGRLMDSFAEATPGEPNFGLRDDVPVPDFSSQEVVIAMKNMKLENENAPVNAPQPNDLGARTDDDVGRVPPEDFIPVSDDDVDAALEQQVELEAADAAEALPDLAADLAEGGEPMKEQTAQEESVKSIEAVRFESRDASTVGATLDGTPAQTFRLGYMGHVIIICQALVHACSTEGDEDPENTAPDSTIEEEDDPRMSLLEDSQQEEAMVNGDLTSDSNPSPTEEETDSTPVEVVEEDPAGRDDGEDERASDSDAEGIPPPNLLMLSKLIDSHPLEIRWHEFVRTTLATETTVQSTPLGGYNNSIPGGDPLHAHRPLEDGDDFDDGSGQPNMPPRGMLGGGDVLDLDDNDLDIAASMMAGLHLGHGGGNDGDDDEDSSDGEEGSEGSGNTYDEQAAKGGYFFDDPLGNKRDSGLGMALGNLGQYHRNGSSDDDEDGSDKGSDHSSEEEDDAPVRRTDSNGDVPVMNLFAGNMPTEEGKSSEASPFEENTWSNFANFDANFDDAFGGDSSADAGGAFTADFGQAVTSSSGAPDGAEAAFTADFGQADTGIAANGEDPFPSPSPDPTKAQVDDIFGEATPHAILLDDGVDTPPDPTEAVDLFTASDNGDKKPEEIASTETEAESPEGSDSRATI